MNDRNSIKFPDASELLFTDENGKSFLANIQVLSIGEYDMVLFSNKIKRFCPDKELSAEEREIIISKILELTPDIRWQIQ